MIVFTTGGAVCSDSCQEDLDNFLRKSNLQAIRLGDIAVAKPSYDFYKRCVSNGALLIKKEKFVDVLMGAC